MSNLATIREAYRLADRWAAPPINARVVAKRRGVWMRREPDGRWVPYDAPPPPEPEQLDMLP